MTTQAHVKPTAGCLVRMPGTYEALPAAGRLVELNSYWLRKQAAGDIEIQTPDEQAPKTKGDKQ